MTEPTYANGYHARWECCIHSHRHHAQTRGKTLSSKEEDEILSKFLTKHRKIANEIVACPSCQEAIADAMLKQQDPFAIPDYLKKEVARYGLDRRYKSVSSSTA